MPQPPVSPSRLACIALLGCCLAVGASSAQDSAPPKEQPAARIYDLKGLRVTIHPPVLLARSDKSIGAYGHVCHPQLHRLSNGELAAIFWAGEHDYATIGQGKQGFAFSADSGASWTEPKFIVKNLGDIPLILPSGDFAFLPYLLSPHSNGMGGPYYLIPKGSREVKWEKEGVEFSGWPRKDKSINPQKGVTGFVCHGQSVKLKDGTYLCTLYGRFEDDKFDSNALAESRDGLHWKIRSIIFDGKGEPMNGMSEGANESALAQLKDGRLLCMFRRGNGARYGQTWSSDGGRTWTPPAESSSPGDVEPSLAALDGGVLALASGRGLDLSFNLDGELKSWQTVSILDHHNTYHPGAGVKADYFGWGTQGMPDLIAVDSTHLVYAYDRWLNSGSSAWTVRITIEKKSP